MGRKSIEKLTCCGLITIGDLLWHIPREYVDYAREVTLDSAPINVAVRVSGTVLSTKRGRTYQRQIPYVECLVDDGTGTLRVVFYQQTYLAKKIIKGEKVVLFGRIAFDRLGRQMANPRLRIGEDEDGSVEAIYREVGGLRSTSLQKWIKSLLCQAPQGDSLPLEVVSREGLIPFKQAMEIIHEPTDPHIIESIKMRTSPAVIRLIFEELYHFQAGLARMMQRAQRRKGLPVSFPDAASDVFLKSLPFTPTGDQLRAMDALSRNIRQGRRLFTLIQGDVGCGKTVVALYAAYHAAGSGWQSAFICPTSILAQQHAETARALLSHVAIDVVLLTSKMSKKEQSQAIERIGSEVPLLVVGTHRLIQDDVRFGCLGLAIVDEQHRFGVRQRGALLNKGQGVHYIALSATPIPRSIAIGFFAGYEVIQIREKPAGRQPIRTILKKTTSRDEVARFATRCMDNDETVFWICPWIDRQEDLGEDVRSIEGLVDLLKERYFRNREIGVVHGRMAIEDINRVLERFRTGQCPLLVATTVVEVGVDMPKASVIVVEGADRFGLSQVHQLRGRVGRKDRPGYCFLMVQESVSGKSLRRLRVLESSDDGFVIAEYDLKQRGFGKLLGVEQSGLEPFVVADIWRDGAILERVQSLLRGDDGP